MTPLSGIQQFDMALHAHLNSLRLQEIRSNPGDGMVCLHVFTGINHFILRFFTKWMQVSKLQQKHIS